ncbi:hypothetical protein EVB39_059 [Rhizobium phage RHph_TM3_3_9]|nr:hypothetical protein EVB39_059 [Rhizobium phage RHph_TM3_3_9]QIG68580.1 hypothetical protein EVB66_059 [Rhizobium phage RHph_TM3_3_13]QIG74438.1 hypothetical protein EVC09_058 [Rhizobium phage RHph_TM3_3_10]QXV74552.1 hypothetical protein [Rhizobium phage RHEph19]
MGILAEQIAQQKEAQVPQGIVTVTPSDTVPLTKAIRGFMVTVAGDVSAVFADGTSGVMPGCTPGIQYMGKITRINLTGTAATGIKGFV